MSTANPTALRLGATGTLDGRRWRVAGRVVLGMQADDGETYYWNEFNLVDGFGRSATLVFEETEAGPEWKLFKFFEPLRAMTAAEAATNRVGDMVTLDGTATRITLVDQSRVYHIEGTGPEGVEVGDVANYFNADTGARMLVASWSGDEIEFYEGRDVPANEVAAAFGVPGGGAALAAGRPAAFTGGASASSGLPLKAVGLALGAVILFGFFSCGLGRRGPRPSVAPPAKQAAPAPRLAAGARGLLGQKTYRIAGHAVVEIARVGSRHDRHEYSLIGDTGERAYLINGLTGGGREWHLFVPVDATGPLAAISPYDAATRRKGAPIPVPERVLHITELFQAKALQSEGDATGAAWPALQFGFVAREADDWLLARWTEGGIQFHRGRPVPEAAVLAALGPGPEKPR